MFLLSCLEMMYFYKYIHIHMFAKQGNLSNCSGCSHPCDINPATWKTVTYALNCIFNFVQFLCAADFLGYRPNEECTIKLLMDEDAHRYRRQHESTQGCTPLTMLC